MNKNIVKSILNEFVVNVKNENAIIKVHGRTLKIINASASEPIYQWEISHFCKTVPSNALSQINMFGETEAEVEKTLLAYMNNFTILDIEENDEYSISDSSNMYKYSSQGVTVFDMESAIRGMGYDLIDDVETRSTYEKGGMNITLYWDSELINGDGMCDSMKVYYGNDNVKYYGRLPKNIDEFRLVTRLLDLN